MARRIQIASTSNRRRGAAAAPLIATPVEDTFTDDDGVELPDHTPNVRPGSEMWVFQEAYDGNTGTIDIETNRAECQDDAVVNIATIDSGVSNCLISGPIRWPDINTVSTDGLVFRYVDGGSYWMAGPVTKTYNYFRLIKRWTNPAYPEAGAVNVIIQTAITASVINTDYEITVRLDGNDITVELDGTHTITVTSDHNASATKHGLTGYVQLAYFGGQKPQFDDFEVARL